MTAQRVLHFTFHKCGSQWVRDVLAAPEVVELSGVKLDGRSPRADTQDWPEQAPNTLLSPMYNARAGEWARHAEPDMKGIVVLRDPRDRMISWLFSFGYSHVRKGRAGLLQHLIPTLTRRQQILLSMSDFARISHMYSSWLKRELAVPRTLVTKYETLVAEGAAGFQRIIDFLEWPVPATVTSAVTERLSFEKRSGRQRGETDIYSHYRKGVAGDWRNYFDRQLGELFEERCPGLLTAAGYESSNDWWHQLPEQVAEVEPAVDREEVPSLKAELTRLREERDELARKCKALESMPPPTLGSRFLGRTFGGRR